MSIKQPDFDIQNYNLEELLDIFGIESPVQKEAIMGIAADFIKKYKKSHNEFSGFKVTQ